MLLDRGARSKAVRVRFVPTARNLVFAGRSRKPRLGKIHGGERGLCIETEWKLLLRYKGLNNKRYRQLHIWDKLPARLYNLKRDPYEKNELSALHPEIVKRLGWTIQAGHPVPNPPAKPVE